MNFCRLSARQNNSEVTMPTDTVLKPPTYDDIVAARPVIARHLRKTPLIFSPSLSEELGCDYYIKAEIFQPTGAFKVRGGINFMGTLDESEKRNQFISASAGNHGQSLAYAGRIFGTRVVVYMSAENPNLFKVNAIRRFGAEVRLHGHNTDEAVAEAQRVAREQGLRYVHHANEPKLIAGVGTMALEIFEELPDVDVIFAPVGVRAARLRATRSSPAIRIPMCASSACNRIRLLPSGTPGAMAICVSIH